MHNHIHHLHKSIDLMDGNQNTASFGSPLRNFTIDPSAIFRTISLNPILPGVEIDWLIDSVFLFFLQRGGDGMSNFFHFVDFLSSLTSVCVCFVDLD